MIQGHKSDGLVSVLEELGKKNAHESAYYIVPLKFNLQPVSDTPLIRGNMRAAILPPGDLLDSHFRAL